MTSFYDRESILDEFFCYSWFCLAVDMRHFTTTNWDQMCASLASQTKLVKHQGTVVFSLVLDKVDNKLQGRFI